MSADLDLLLDPSPKQILSTLTPAEQEQWLRNLGPGLLAELSAGAWWYEARPKQLPPPGNWTVWEVLAGRGWGKNRTGAEWTVDRALTYPVDTAGEPTHQLVLAPTIDDAARGSFGGSSGILAALRKRGYTESTRRYGRPGLLAGPKSYTFTSGPKPSLQFGDNGQQIHSEGCANEDVGRSYNLIGFWWDEVGKCRYTWNIWEKALLPALRIDIPGDRPRGIMTTTGKPLKLLKYLRDRARRGDPFVHLTTGSTFENVDNLSVDMVKEFRKAYEGTSIGRQELYGEVLDQAEGALWTQDILADTRVEPDNLPAMKSVSVGMDPAGTGTRDETGLVAVGLGEDGDWYVLADWSKKIAGKAACRRAWELFRKVDADWLVVEDNFAKAYLRDMLVDVYNEMIKEGLFPEWSLPPLKTVTALKGKRLRAEPVALRWEQQRAHMVGHHLELESQCTTWEPDEKEGADSPDRIDAMVHAAMFHRHRERGRAMLSEPAGQVSAEQDPPLHSGPTAVAVMDRMPVAGMGPLA